MVALPVTALLVGEELSAASLRAEHPLLPRTQSWARRGPKRGLGPSGLQTRVHPMPEIPLQNHGAEQGRCSQWGPWAPCPTLGGITMLAPSQGWGASIFLASD